MLREKVSSLFQVLKASLGLVQKETVGSLRGELIVTMRDGKTGEVLHSFHKKNLIVLDASILVARLLANNTEPPHGLFVLAVGTGDVGWNPLAPPAPTNTQRALYAELTRKTFASVQFVDGAGVPVAYPTKTVDFTTTFSEAEAVGPLVEMGLIGGNISNNMAIKNPVSPPNGPYNAAVDLTLFETLFNYTTFPVISKPPTATLTITWRIVCLGLGHFHDDKKPRPIGHAVPRPARQVFRNRCFPDWKTRCQHGTYPSNRPTG